MTFDEMRRALSGILDHVTPEAHADVSATILTLTDELETLETTTTDQASSIATLTANNERLRAVNGDLLRRVGTTAPKSSNSPNGENSKTLTFEALFNEKGELK